MFFEFAECPVGLEVRRVLGFGIAMVRLSPFPS